MLKVGKGKISSIKGLENAINEKIAVSVPSDAANTVPQLYVQDVRNNYFNNIIIEKHKNINGNNLSEDDNTDYSFQSDNDTNKYCAENSIIPIGQTVRQIQIYLSVSLYHIFLFVSILGKTDGV